MSSRPLFLRLLILILVLLSSVSAFAQDPKPPLFEPLEECFLEIPEGIDFDCGYVTVPDFYYGESTRDLQLGVVRLKAASDTPASPLFMLAGGPGQSMATLALPVANNIVAERSSPDLPPTFAGIVENHDIVFMAQRGTEFTDAVLSCPETGSLAYTAWEQKLDAAAAEALYVDTLVNCANRLVAQGIQFEAYNSEANAADVLSVVEALGYDRIIYYGESYGAQLGQFVMRDYPGILEAVILDGANPLSKTSWVQDRAQSFQTVLDNFVALCAVRPACTEAYGDLSAVIDAAVAVFADGPQTYTYQDPENPNITVEVQIGLEELASFINSELGFVGDYAIPLIFKAVSEGQLETIGEPMAASILGSKGMSNPGAMLMQIAMVCSDDPVYSESEADAEGVTALALAAGRVEAQSILVGCQVLDVAPLPENSDVDVSLDVPALLFSGGLDTRTPTVRNQEVADHLPNSRVIVFPVGSHVQVPNIPCANQILAEFVDDPAALDNLDTECVAEFTAEFEFSTLDE